MSRHGRFSPAVLAGLGIVALVATSCHAPARLGVSTTVVAVQGRCDTSAIVGVGASLPLTGADRAVGLAELTGLELGVTQVNDSGGVLASHHCLELLYKDDHSDPAVDNQALLDLVNQEHVALVAGPLLALDDQADGAHLGGLNVTATSFSAQDSTYTPRTYPDTFPMVPSIAEQADLLAATASRHHWRRVAVVRSGTTVAGEGVDAFLQAARARGIVITAAPRIADSPAEARTALAALRESRPDALIVFDGGPTLTPVLSVRHALGWSVPVLVSTVNVPSLPSSVLGGVDAIIPSALAVSHSIPSSLAAFRARLLRALGQPTLAEPITVYAQAYDAVEMFAGAATGVNADDPGSIRTYLENANFLGVAGSYNYTSSHHAGLEQSQISVVPLRSLSNGFFVVPHSA
jgi:ABC-type branched-subunit amino acid transport system substrate-binding protein